MHNDSSFYLPLAEKKMPSASVMYESPWSHGTFSLGLTLTYWRKQDDLPQVSI